MHGNWRQLLNASLFGLAGLCLFIMILNRALILIRDSRAKAPLTTLFFVALTGGSIATGWLSPLRPWAVLPIAFLAAVVLGEVHRALVRRRCRGSAPTRTEARPVPVGQVVTTTALELDFYELAHPAWQGPDFRIAHVSDIHVTASLPSDYYRQVMATVSGTKPDLLFITGDFVARPKGIALLPQVLNPAGAQGNFAILGNHDLWAGSEEISRALTDAGFTMLSNAHQRVAIDGHNLLVTGCEDPWAPYRWKPPAREDGEPMLALSHTPDNVYRLRDAGAFGVFAGHYHGGQFRLPMIGSVVIPSIYGRRFDHGHFDVDGTHLFVTAGVGVAMPPVRICCPPDVFIVDVKRAA